MRVLVIAWAPGGNLPPMLAAASLLARREHDVRFVASGATRAAVEQLGFEAVAFRRTPDPDTTVAFETHAEGLQLPSDAPPERIASALHALIRQPRFADAAALLRDRIAAEDPDGGAVAALEGQSGAAWSPSTRSDRSP